MYSQQNKRNVTYIDDLPDLEDLESRGTMSGVPYQGRVMGIDNHVPFQNQGPPGDIPEKYKNFIRSSMGAPPPESGMNPGHGRVMSQHEFFPPPQQQQQQQAQRWSTDTPTCIDVHEHVQTCPICSRFFKNDNTVYIITIVILAIVCILLLKRVLNV